MFNAIQSKARQHPVFSYAASLVAAFLAGVAFLSALAGVGLFGFSQAGAKGDANCSLASQVEKLRVAHEVRLNDLHAKLIESEKEAVYGGHLSSNQEKYIAASKRFREMIADENFSFERQANALAKIEGGAR